jgi:hypothetical protein
LHSEYAPVRISARTLPILGDIVALPSHSSQIPGGSVHMNTTNPLKKTLSNSQSISHSSSQSHTARISSCVPFDVLSNANYRLLGRNAT